MEDRNPPLALAPSLSWLSLARLTDCLAALTQLIYIQRSRVGMMEAVLGGHRSLHTGTTASCCRRVSCTASSAATTPRWPPHWWGPQGHCVQHDSTHAIFVHEADMTVVAVRAVDDRALDKILHVPLLANFQLVTSIMDSLRCCPTQMDMVHAHVILTVSPLACKPEVGPHAMTPIHN